MGLEETVAKKIDRIAQMLNCPEKGEELRRAITESRKDFLLNQPEEAEIEEEDVLDDEVFEDDEDDEYDEFDWTTE
jgi:ABC-type hemin transport system substrate-binding protein